MGVRTVARGAPVRVRNSPSRRTPATRMAASMLSRMRVPMWPMSQASRRRCWRTATWTGVSVMTTDPDACDHSGVAAGLAGIDPVRQRRYLGGHVGGGPGRRLVEGGGSAEWISWPLGRRRAG